MVDHQPLMVRCQNLVWAGKSFSHNHFSFFFNLGRGDDNFTSLIFWTTLTLAIGIQ